MLRLFSGATNSGERLMSEMGWEVILNLMNKKWAFHSRWMDGIFAGDEFVYAIYTCNYKLHVPSPLVGQDLCF